MITEPELHADILQPWLNLHYNLVSHSLEFLPAGECGWHYLITGEDDTRYVLKLSRPDNCSTPPMNQQAIQAVQALYYEFGINQMSPPPERATTGQYINTLRGYTAVLLHYVEGVPSHEQPLDETQQRQLGALLARIHRAKLHVRERPTAEDFAPELATMLRRILIEADAPTRRYAAFHLKCLRIINNVAAQIHTRMEEFLRLQHILREDAGLHADYVVCHGDPSSGNIIIRPDETIALIDWDAPVYAPRERDLFFVRDMPIVMEAYTNAAGEVNLRADVLRFYQLQWDLGEIVDYGTRILFRRQSKAQNKHDVLCLMTHFKDAGFL
jgi:spectinomycin phosphotransferase